VFGNEATVLVGDTPKDVEAGLAAGVPVIGVATGKTSAEELRQAGAQYVVADLTDFLEPIEQLLRRLGA
jgi:phosphoglycolate phosphatase